MKKSDNFVLKLFRDLYLMRIYQHLFKLMVSLLLLTNLSACFTGVESTKKITDKDVRRAMQELERGKKTMALSEYADSVPAWHDGKTFWVVDDLARLVFSPSLDYEIDSLVFCGKQLVYKGIATHRQVDNTEVVDLLFSDGIYTFVYPTGKTLVDISQRSFAVPFLVDGDMVKHYANQIVGKTVYVKTSTWQTVTGDKIVGRKFIPVVITAIGPGNGIYPLRAEFKTTDGVEAMLWMTIGTSSISGRDFDSLFSLTDVRLQYPEITAENWTRIVNGEVVEGMTKQECRLSMGSPKSVNQRPDQTGLKEYWYYDGGRYLFFFDGLLKEFR